MISLILTFVLQYCITSLLDSQTVRILCFLTSRIYDMSIILQPFRNEGGIDGMSKLSSKTSTPEDFDTSRFIEATMFWCVFVFF